MTSNIILPPWQGQGKRIESTIRKALYDYQLLDKTTHLAIALSGGKDSLTMLYMLNAIRGHGFSNFKITAFHVSGDFSCGASQSKLFLKKICKSLEVDFVELEQSQKIEELSCYPCSRERRRLIFSAMKKRGIQTVAFGHHQDDSIQTLLMNLLHKGEFAANLPKVLLHHYGVTIIRPLILISERDIIEFSKKNQYNRIVCRCPVGQNSMRRQADKLLHSIEKVFPNARHNLARGARIYGSNKALTP